MKLGKTGYSVLKSIHILFASIWLGSGVCLLFLLAVDLAPACLDGQIHAIRILDLFVVIPAVLGLFMTGLLFSIFTNWGFIQHRWIIVKYIINLLPMLFGGIIMAPPLLGMIRMVDIQGSQVLNSPEFISYKLAFLSPLIALFVLALVALYLSVFKPRLGQPKTKN